MHNSELEMHMKESNEAEKKHKCEECTKEFFLEWRLKKHKKIHSEGAKYCRFYNYNKHCIYEEMGRMFLHIRSEQCMFDPFKNKLCQFRHDMHEDGDNELDDDEQVTKKNQCHLCYKQLSGCVMLAHFFI